ncbi:hypothetical protein AXK61_06205 [Tsukamurella pseudospumae]|uniref:NAD(P)-binding domain-containing protein n=1 Tax=Tsukamurella pseudospumae TaxID=239498 RepID=A0A137YYY9_9ACTN|nr:hypothetical protein AXK61_06205 [Tsukamurella pseudospumae]
MTAAGRNRDRLDELAARGFATATVDLSSPARAAEVVSGHSEVVLISGGDPDRLDQHRGVIEAARAAGVDHIYYTSGIRADDERFPINVDHRATEQALAASTVT